MFQKYYQEELKLLKDTQKSFFEKNPFLANAFNRTTTDPDVQRLLEGVAFLTAHLQQKLDDEYSEMAQALTHCLHPHFLAPTPSATIIQFSPTPGLQEAFVVQPGVFIDSKPVNQVACRFRTCAAVETLPLCIESVNVLDGTRSDQSCIEVGLRLDNMNLNEWQNKCLRFHLTGDLVKASDLFFLLNHFLDHIEVQEADQSAIQLDKTQLSAAGFLKPFNLYGIKSPILPAHRWLHEYFHFPRKFLFLDLNLADWQTAGSQPRFKIRFHCQDSWLGAPTLDDQSLALFCTPAVNLFPHSAEPLKYEYQQAEIAIHPAHNNQRQYQVHSVDKVSSLKTSSGKIQTWKNLHEFRFEHPDEQIYQICQRQTLDNQILTYLRPTLNAATQDNLAEAISIQLTCSNGELPGQLGVGDVNGSTENSPELVNFTNICVPSKFEPIPLDNQHLWNLLIHCSAHSAGLEDVQALKTVLGIYLPQQAADKNQLATNQRRVQGIVSLKRQAQDKLFNFKILHGVLVELTVQPENYLCDGDMFLFGSIIAQLLEDQTSLNTYSQLVMTDHNQSKTIQWQPKLGNP